MKQLKFAIDSYNFKKIIESGSFYIDKTLFIKELIEDETGIFLFPRPRRFGKSLNFSMLKHFFDIKEDSKELFKDLEISKYSEVLKHMNQYPVVNINFKGMDELSWEKAKKQIKSRIAQLYEDHKEVKEMLSDKDKQIYDLIINQEALDLNYQESLLNLTKYLEKKYNKKVILLIDEYDAVMTKMFLRTEEEFIKCMNMFRGIYENAFKGNDSLYKGLLTGITRVAKEGIFSGLNNVKSRGITSSKYSEYFGFLEKEIKPIIEEQKLNFKEAKDWYNGYNFGGNTVYNPWSIANYLDDRKLEPYWKNTSGNDLVRELIKKGGPELKQNFEKMLKGESVKLKLDDNVNLRDLNIEDVYSLLLQTGYLTYEEINNEKFYKIPNKEVVEVIEKFKKEIDNKILDINLESYFIHQEWEIFEDSVRASVKEALSFYDIPEGINFKENFYHTLFLGMLLTFRNYQVKSNRETGMGRADIMLKSKMDNRHYVFEIKAGNNKDDLDKLLKRAEIQIKDRGYGEDLRGEVTKIGIAFIDKNVKMKIF